MIKYIQTFFPVYIGVCLCEKDWKKEMKRMGVSESPQFVMKDATVHLFSDQDSNTCIFLCFDPATLMGKNKRHANQVASLIAHEAVHVVDYVFEDIGEKNAGHETRAYLTQRILQDTLYLIDDFMKAKKKK